MAKVAISVGHTSSDPGSQVGGETEFNIASKIGAEVINILKDRGVDVYTVPFDADLATTIDWINRGDFSMVAGDVCVDIHINDGGQSGIEGWHKDRGENKSYQLTKAIVDATAKATGLSSLGAKSEFDHSFGKLAFVHNTNCISTLIECGFLDNPIDANLLKTFDGIKKFATGIANGVEEFLGAASAVVSKSSLQATAVPAPVPVPASPVDLGGNIPSISPLPTEFSASPGGVGLTERREMIKQLYREVLGKEADPEGLSYYMYRKPTATEDQIRKEMSQSTEHLRILRRARKARKLRDRTKALEEEVSMSGLALDAKENEIANMQKLLQMKNQEIAAVRKHAPSQAPIVPQGQTQMFDSQSDLDFSKRQMGSAQAQVIPQEQVKRGKGCVGWIREIFGF